MSQIKIYRFDASGCNGCDIEALSMLALKIPGLEGIELASSPKEASIMLVTGGVNEKTLEELKNAYIQLPEPKLVIAAGTCAASMCVFKRGYNMRGPVENAVPVKFFVMGCPPRPQNLASALAHVLDVRLEKKTDIWQKPDCFRGKLSLDENKCTGCGACVQCCPSEAIDLSVAGDHSQIAFNLWKCSFCGTCEEVCPEKAVKLSQEFEMSHKKKDDAVVKGKMPMARCATCGGTAHAKEFIKAIKGRIYEHKPDYKGFEQKIDGSLALCDSCKRKIENVKKNMLDMREWVYD